MTPKEFEQEIAKIHSILEKRNAKVTWDARIPDPDNPKQLRQVDILIEKDRKFTIVECRHHKKKQDVKWIEEIYGRRVSLEAFSAIAVSSSGFTIGAIKKAEKLGVILRTFEDVTANEISSWGSRFSFDLNYIKFNKFVVYVVLPSIILPVQTNSNNGFITSSGEAWPIEELFTKMAKSADETKSKRDFLTAFMNIKKDLYYCGQKVEEIIVQCEFRRLTKKVWLPSVHSYSSPIKQTDESVFKSSSQFNKSEVYQSNKSVFQVIDLSMAKPIDGAVFRSITQNFEQEVTMSGIGIIGYKGPEKSLFPLTIQTIRKSSGVYQALDGQHYVSNVILSS